MKLNLPVRIALGLAIVAVLIVAMVTVPSVLNSYQLYLATEVIIFTISGFGLTVLIGWSGQIALAQAGFFGVGAYGTAYLSTHSVPWLGGVLIAAVVAALLGVIIGLPSVRLKGFYLAIATLAFGSLLQRVFIEAKSITGGVSGITVTPLEFLGLTTYASLWYASVLIAFVCTGVLWWLGRSRPGRAFRAVRDSEIATRSLGISATKYKLLAFAISAFMGSVAGSLYGQLISYLTPDSFTTALMIQFLVVVFIGGVVDLAGALIGAIFLVVSVELLQDLGSWQRLAYGLALVVVVRVLPRGITSLPRRLLRFKRSKEVRPHVSSRTTTSDRPSDDVPKQIVGSGQPS